LKIKENAVSNAITEQHAARRPYDAPRILSREPLEVVAAVCGGPTGTGKANALDCDPDLLTS
jgi:hypothetical protein